MRLLFYVCPLLVFAGPQTTMLSQAEAISELYSKEIAKALPPAQFPLATAALSLSSVWFSLDLATQKTENWLPFLTQDETWQILNEIGFDGVHIQNLRNGGQIGLPRLAANIWPQILKKSQDLRIALIGDLIGNATIAGVDFQDALQNIGDYPSLYHLIEIPSTDWALLPPIPYGYSETNIPWLTLQTLQKKGYVPRNYNPYIKESDWNATDKVTGKDGKIRRWIYLKEGNNRPVLAWLSPSFAAYRLAAGDAVNICKEFGTQIIQLDGKIPGIAQNMLSLWVRKLGCFSATLTNGTLQSMKNASTDLMYDAITRPALLHALIAQDAEALRMIYRLMLNHKIDAHRMVHVLQPFDQYACDWVELMQSPKMKFRYYEEQITGEVLKNRLLKEDVLRLGSFDQIPPTTWVDHCARALNVKDFEKHSKEISHAHLLLAFTYAMQPGAFSISLDDLLGTMPNHPEGGLYGDLPRQMKNGRSFSSKLKAILQARRESNIVNGELIEVMLSPHPGTLLLLYRLPSNRFMYLLAVNFARNEVIESIEREEISQTTAIDLMSKLSVEKVFSSASFSFNLPPLSGRAFYFQPKYYD